MGKKIITLSLKGQSHEIFYTQFFHQSVHSGPIRDVHGLFYYFLLFHRVIALLKQLPVTLDTGGVATPRYPKGRGVVFITLILT